MQTFGDCGRGSPKHCTNQACCAARWKQGIPLIGIARPGPLEGPWLRLSNYLNTLPKAPNSRPISYFPLLKMQ
jgi:hypothetical protein